MREGPNKGDVENKRRQRFHIIQGNNVRSVNPDGSRRHRNDSCCVA